MALLVPLLLNLDHKDEALALDDEAVQAFNDQYRLFGPIFHGGHVQALLARRQTADALSYARHALSTIGIVPYVHLAGLTAMAQACIEVLEKERGTAREKDIRGVSRRALRALHGYVWLYPFARARYELYLGRYRAVQGRNTAAQRHWTRGLRAAHDAGLRLDGARIRLLLADQLPEGSPAHIEHLHQARRTIDELGLRRLKEFERLND